MNYKLTILLFITPLFLQAQQPAADSLLQQATLDNVVAYAIKHQPLIQQSLIDEQVTESLIKSKLADWYPQLDFRYNLQHNFQLQQAIIGGNVIKFGVDNTSAAQFTVNQNIFNRDVLLASRTKSDALNSVKQITTSDKIDVAANVSKAFYDVLASMQQIKVADEGIVRLERSLKDATSRYNTGIADKTDYKRATIALNNTRAAKKSNEALLKAKLEYLKSLMGYPTGSDLNIVYDSLQMEKEMMVDTLQSPDYSKRIEYQILATRKKLQEAEVKYNKWSYLPSVSAYGAYNFNFQDNNFGKLYNQNFPTSYGGLTLTVPILQGGKRKFNIQQQELKLKRIDWDFIALQHSINAQYSQSLALYKSNMANYQALKENVNLAKEVYDIIQLQYSAGVKTYLEVVSAETDLRTAQINYYNALYELLASKIDVEKSLGQINY
ncbi:MAG TPA: TolC family protein [Panacibacter sp.]|nr:TolC family protein [Panacibacter sp.]